MITEASPKVLFVTYELYWPHDCSGWFLHCFLYETLLAIATSKYNISCFSIEVIGKVSCHRCPSYQSSTAIWINCVIGFPCQQMLNMEFGYNRLLVTRWLSRYLFGKDLLTRLVVCNFIVFWGMCPSFPLMFWISFVFWFGQFLESLY